MLRFGGAPPSRNRWARGWCRGRHKPHIAFRRSHEGIVSRRLKQVAVALVVVLAAAQVVRPGRANPPTDASRTIQAQMAADSGLVTVLDRACRDCHSNRTVWPWYTQVAPVSWLMAYGVSTGRKAVNFSEWGAYPPERQRTLLAESCRDVTAGKMPGPYALLHPETRLSARDVEVVCAAGHLDEAHAANGR